LKIVAHDFSRFVKATVQFGDAIRDVNLKRDYACLLADTTAILRLL